MPQFTRDGAHIHFETMGDGPPLLAIAGIASDGASWLPIVPLLEKHFKLILIDNRGAGRTRCPLDTVNVEAMRDDCLGLLDHLGIDKAHVMGHSMGAMIGLRIADAAPERVHRLVAMAGGTAGTYRTQMLMEDLARLNAQGVERAVWFRMLFYWLFAGRFFADAEALNKRVQASLDYAHAPTNEMFAAQVRAGRALAPFDVSGMQVPTLSLMGEEDILIPPPAVRALLKLHPQLTSTTLAKAAHSMHWDAPTDTAEAIVRFLQD